MATRHPVVLRWIPLRTYHCFNFLTITTVWPVGEFIVVSTRRWRPITRTSLTASRRRQNWSELRASVSTNRRTPSSVGTFVVTMINSRSRWCLSAALYFDVTFSLCSCFTALMSISDWQILRGDMAESLRFANPLPVSPEICIGHSGFWEGSTTTEPKSFRCTHVVV